MKIENEKYVVVGSSCRRNLKVFFVLLFYGMYQGNLVTYMQNKLFVQSRAIESLYFDVPVAITIAFAETVFTCGNFSELCRNKVLYSP